MKINISWKLRLCFDTHQFCTSFLFIYIVNSWFIMIDNIQQCSQNKSILRMSRKAIGALLKPKEEQLIDESSFFQSCNENIDKILSSHGQVYTAWKIYLSSLVYQLHDVLNTLATNIITDNFHNIYHWLLIYSLFLNCNHSNLIKFPVWFKPTCI